MSPLWLNLQAASARLCALIEQAARCAGQPCGHGHQLAIAMARTERDAAARLWRRER